MNPVTESTPEPASLLALLGVGVFGASSLRKGKRKQAA
ncbi:MAG: PEP-CTERM sorting domain-containing protein [Coleofasciculaceae cyanobacterium SM2_3_26]|nr:PEP-CTERM sorting domain-containing protein [Coleofasciculaceae cyanobacterium SM2_3_26]